MTNTNARLAPFFKHYLQWEIGMVGKIRSLFEPYKPCLVRKYVIRFTIVRLAHGGSHKKGDAEQEVLAYLFGCAQGTQN
jgi:hypothetical protein